MGTLRTISSIAAFMTLAVFAKYALAREERADILRPCAGAKAAAVVLAAGLFPGPTPVVSESVAAAAAAGAFG